MRGGRLFMEYPLIIDGQKRGKMRVEREGLYTVFEAELPGVYDGLYRIWAHGGGESFYLGLMQPWSGGMYLRKKLSRNAMGGTLQIVEKFSNTEREKGESPEEKPAEPEKTALSCPWPAPIEAESGELLWLRRGDGSLVSHDGKSSLVALPAQLRRDCSGAVMRFIEGREYMIFRY